MMRLRSYQMIGCCNKRPMPPRPPSAFPISVSLVCLFSMRHVEFPITSLVELSTRSSEYVELPPPWRISRMLCVLDNGRECCALFRTAASAKCSEIGGLPKLPVNGFAICESSSDCGRVKNFAGISGNAVEGKARPVLVP